ncbi:uncharacterized protein LOC135398311 [Ornithodoros turicata]|uniref:uncharacterized protein LOC135398311 n=1 Tax=Ornithodoros turicata TaxID=34597 RepID=UPI0031398573
MNETSSYEGPTTERLSIDGQGTDPDSVLTSWPTDSSSPAILCLQSSASGDGPPVGQKLRKEPLTRSTADTSSTGTSSGTAPSSLEGSPEACCEAGPRHPAMTMLHLPRSLREVRQLDISTLKDIRHAKLFKNVSSWWKTMRGLPTEILKPARLSLTVGLPSGQTATSSGKPRRDRGAIEAGDSACTSRDSESDSDADESPIFRKEMVARKSQVASELSGLGVVVVKKATPEERLVKAAVDWWRKVKGFSPEVLKPAWRRLMKNKYD